MAFDVGDGDKFTARLIHHGPGYDDYEGDLAFDVINADGTTVATVDDTDPGAGVDDASNYNESITIDPDQNGYGGNTERWYLKVYAPDSPKDEDCPNGGSGSCDGEFEIQFSNQPDASISENDGDDTLVEGTDSITFDASGSSDPDGDISEYRWDFDGDGSTDKTTSSATTSHTYSIDDETYEGGSATFTPEVTVADSAGGTDTATLGNSLTIHNDFDEDDTADINDNDGDDDGIDDKNDPADYNRYPSASDSSSESTDDNKTLDISNGDSADLDELATDGGKSYDPNTDSITFEQVDGESFSAGGTVTLASGATVVVNSDGSWTYDPNGAYDSLTSGDSETDEFNYTVSDDQHSGTTGATDQGTVTITINGVNTAPAVPNDDDSVTNEIAEDAATNASVGVTANSTDPEAASVTWSLTDTASGRFQVNQSGIVTVDNASKVDYEGANNNNYTVTAEASDGSLTSTSDFTINVSDVEESPAFTSDNSTTANESDSDSANVLDVNADVGGSDDEGVSYQFTGGNDDAAGNGGGAFAIDSTSGQITIDDTEDIDESQQGNFSLTVEASEGSQHTTQTVTITIADDVGPTFQSASSTPADDATGHLPSDNISLSFDEIVTLDSGDIEIVDDGDGSDTRTLDVTTSSVSTSESTVTLSPSSNLESDTDYHVEVEGTAIDDTFTNSYGGISDSTTYSFTSADTAPAFSKGASTSVTVTEEGSTNLTSELEVADISASDTLNWSVASAPSNGTLSDVDNASESVSGSASPHTLSTPPTYTPDADFAGSDSFDVAVEDDGPGSTDTITVSVTVDTVNDAPSFSLPAGSNQSVGNDTSQQKQTQFIDITTFDPGGGSDESSQSISEFTVSNDNSTLFASPPHIDNQGDLTYTPAAGVEGTATVDVQVIDDNGTSNGGDNTSAPKNFTITVDNRSPSISSSSVSNPSGQDVAFSFESDEQLSTINVSISGAESATLNQSDLTETDNNGSYSYDATYNGSTDGDYTATIELVKDTAGNNATGNQSLSVTVDTSNPELRSNDAGMGGVGDTQLEINDGETTVTVEGTEVEVPADGASDEAEDGESGRSEAGAGDGETAGGPAPDMTVTVNDPDPGQTLIVTESGASILDAAASQQDGAGESEDAQTDGEERGAQQTEGEEAGTQQEGSQATDSQQSATSGGGGGGDSAGAGGVSSSNVRANQLSVDVNTDSDFQLSMTTYENDLTPSSAVGAGSNPQSVRPVPLARGASMMKVRSGTVRATEGLAPGEVEAAARSFESQTGTVPAGYIQVDTTLTPEEVTDATVQFSIRRAYLDELGVEPDRVTLYHQLGDDEWETRDTEYVDSDEMFYYFDGSMPEFSVFALGTGASMMDVADARLTETTIATDETATVTTTITNRGTSTGETTVELTVDGEVVDSKTVTLDGQTTTNVTFSVAPGAPGEYDIAVGAVDLAGLTVEAAEESTPTPARAETDGEDTPAENDVTADNPGGSGFPVGPVGVLGGLVVLLLTVGPKLRQSGVGDDARHQGRDSPEGGNYDQGPEDSDHDQSQQKNPDHAGHDSDQ